ncbi:type I restriction enzyme S subunit [Pseudoscardovia suis]|uniref:Type I restriction-modification system, specificity subunit S n=1 Tax=Pseudoscardovia suis TaxID=987063 RepID=A0A261ERR0_9BIFI|nr:type I restriction-modification system, specificity subunit S [Pseudoscardovia suis]PJJ69661.1 type I restriction enzyme S subunit [Pseudoscardovia suis]
MGEVVSASGIKNREQKDLQSYSISNQSGFIPQSEQFDNGGKPLDADKSSYWIVAPHSFAYNPARINVGSIGYWNGEKPVIVSSLYEVFQTHESVDDSFLSDWFRTRLFTNQIAKRQEGGVRQYFFFDKLQESRIRLPSLPEQRRIGEFFSALDSLIAAAERQEALLKQKKQAYLQLMFPQEGETRPRLRFNGFSGEWESLQLGKLYEKNTERNGNQFDAGKTLSVSSMTFNAFGNGAAEESLTTYKVLRIGDAAFEGHTSNEFAFGRFVVNTIGDGIMSPRFTAIRPTARWRQSCDLDFWSCYLHDENVMKRILVRSTKRGTMMNELVLDDFFTERIRVPSLPEQRHIGKFFSTLESLIAAAEERTKHLRELKGSYLQRMFV